MYEYPTGQSHKIERRMIHCGVWRHVNNKIGVAIAAVAAVAAVVVTVGKHTHTQTSSTHRWPI